MNEPNSTASNLKALGTELVSQGERVIVCGASDKTAEQIDRIKDALESIARKIRAEVRSEDHSDD